MGSLGIGVGIGIGIGIGVGIGVGVGVGVGIGIGIGVGVGVGVGVDQPLTVRFTGSVTSVASPTAGNRRLAAACCTQDSSPCSNM